MSYKSYIVIGGAGFIGSHLVDALLKQPEINKVTVYDNFSSGREWHLQHHSNNSRLSVIKNDVKNLEALKDAMKGHDVVIHLASNPDIARAIHEPSIDFIEGMYLTHQVLEAARLTNTKRIIYTSGSGVYGDVGTLECNENQGSLLPISTYGASKLSGEAFISSYCHMFNLSACVFRFGNVVGPRQTHGVGYDFVKKLLKDPNQLTILGDGTQSKSYIHIDDVINAIFLANDKMKSPYEIYNVATGDYITVREISKIVVEKMQIPTVHLEFGKTDRGWKGDVPIVRLNTDKIRSLGWKCQRNSAQAIKDSVSAMLAYFKEGVIQ